MNKPRILLAAGASGSGKTLITCGLLQVLLNRGLKPASFKCGPDYIDPMFHTQVIGTRSRNLDTFFTSASRTRYLLAKNAADCDLAVMEGVMGYYDGVGGTTTAASAYDLARVTDTPVILIVDSKGMSLSLMAYIKGFLEYKQDSRICGVIFNRMSPMLYPRMKKLVEEELGIRAFGYVPKAEDCVLESRHLGLVLPEEIPGLRERLKRLALILEESLDIEGILELAKSAVPLEAPENLAEEDAAFGFHGDSLRIGLARDEAFCFLYEDNLELLQSMGAELVPFSPVHDAHLPEGICGLLLYGGYPELAAQELEKNISMRQEIAAAIAEGMPCMAECGGFMYLHEKMEGMDGNLYQMAGVLPGKAFRTDRLTRFGYITLEQREPVFGERELGETRAHEFHYFDSENCGEAFHAKKPAGKRGWDCIHGGKSLLAGFPHLYYYANPRIPRAFLNACHCFNSGDGESARASEEMPGDSGCRRPDTEKQ